MTINSQSPDARQSDISLTEASLTKASLTDAQSAARLQAAADELGITLSGQQIAQLLDYARLFMHWNKAYNLSAVRTLPMVVDRHLIDSLSVVSQVAAYCPKCIADIGTGGGLPGVVLAILFADTPVYLVESIGKKCRFLSHVRATLPLNNVEVIQQRVEAWQPEFACSVVVSRAFASLKQFTQLTRHLGDESSVWLAMKSADIADELNALQDSEFVIASDKPITVPFEPAKRRLISLTLRKTP
ncbi:16S rRNA (guanine(527)-N(7))-methyltransferase RsmG [Ostreibacterium oceani]|uniref:Ribosomal RNA small subunit methyltransferase G n=1 Tax=Ostreibacterium oceani TaxID=2654998 RepID=A0A6N7EXD3_9GAMM|nr:16S rRNA (guanine(527)-N(7))-methyltransferase RsmG [Ostreibacterium oceani]MPV86603.1 16S rRNA (guanine(527)-N(7))-methyltransferase RsmG [Ostreibacterium oceani]